MRLVIDSNQISPFLKMTVPLEPRYVVHRITLSPYIVAEVLLRPDSYGLLAHLRNFDIRYGLEPPEIMLRLAGHNESEISQFKPFENSTERDSLSEMLVEKPAACVDWATAMKRENRKFGALMFQLATRFRVKLRNERLFLRLNDMSEALQLSFLPSVVLASISNKSQRQLVVSNPDRLYSAVMDNSHLSRFFKTVLYFIVSYSRMWADQIHNFDASRSRDDWADITLPLYAEDGDVLVTADKKLCNAIKMVDPRGDVKARTTYELFRSDGIHD
jgi:hypothetical protein